MKVEEIMTSKKLVTVPEDSTVSDALSRMRSTGVHQVPVVSGKRYLGMLSYKEIMRRSIRSNSKVESFMTRTARITPKTDLIRAVKLLRDSGLTALPVVDSGLLVGILSTTDILKNLSKIVEPGKLQSVEVMSYDPVVIVDDDPIDKALEKFRALDESEMPVVSKTGEYLGILKVDEISPSKLLNETTRQAPGNLEGETEKLRINAGSLSLREGKVNPQTSIEDCAGTMVRHKLRAIPVVDASERVVGIVGASDIISVISTGENKEGVLIQVSGLDPWDDDLYDIVFFNASKFVARLPRLAGIKSGNFDVHVAKYHTEGRTKYSIRTRLVGGSVNMSINDYEWNFGKCMDRIIETYEYRLIKLRGK